MPAESATEIDPLVVAFELIGEQGWAGFSPVALAKRAGLPLVEVYQQLPDRASVLRALSERTDQAMLQVDEQELEGLPPRDKLFELIMRRLDALAPFRDGLARLGRDARREPCVVLSTVCRLDRSLGWMQELAGLRRHGLRARAQRRALMAVYLQTLRVWFGDKNADLAKTMAELDRLLRRIETVAGLRERRARPPRGEAAQPT